MVSVGKALILAWGLSCGCHQTVARAGTIGGLEQLGDGQALLSSCSPQDSPGSPSVGFLTDGAWGSSMSILASKAGSASLYVFALNLQMCPAGLAQLLSVDL